MSKYVLDASAILALLNAEKGADIIQGLLPEALVSAVNLAEVATRLSAAGMPEDKLREAWAYLGLETQPFDEEQAFQTELLFPVTQALGLSLGDRACLSLARANAATAVTADQVWKELQIGIPITLIR